MHIQQISVLLSEINASRSEKHQILLAVDGLHGFGVEDFKVEELGRDFFIAGCHKWLFGPRGTGLIWGSEKGWEKIIPIATSFKAEAFWAWYKKTNPDEHCPKAWLCMPGGFQAYEHRWALSKAFDFHLFIGKKAISDRIYSLSSYCKERIDSIPHVRLCTPLENNLSSGMVCFDVEGQEPSLVVEKLLEKRIVSGQTPYRRSCCRFTPGIINKWSDLEIALDALEKIASE
jgi:selenocysteine lyase/cysteine desulfurase